MDYSTGVGENSSGFHLGNEKESGNGSVSVYVHEQASLCAYLISETLMKFTRNSRLITWKDGLILKKKEIWNKRRNIFMGVDVQICILLIKVFIGQVHLGDISSMYAGIFSRKFEMWVGFRA